jgi:hypothetical protein
MSASPANRPCRIAAIGEILWAVLPPLEASAVA